MTNEHCPKSKKEWLSTLVDFDFDEPGTRPTNVNAFEALVMKNSEGLDFAIFRLRFPVTDRQPLTLDAAVPPIGKSLLLIQHPAGEIKQISIIDCHAVSPPPGFPSSPHDLVHRCDSKGGSSGSALIDETRKKVIGLHHVGWDDQRVPLPAKELQLNRAVLMRDIIEDIKRQNQAIAAELGFP